MSILQDLDEMISRQEVSDLVKKVAIKSLNPDSQGKFLNLFIAKDGEVEWQNFRPSVIDLKGKLLRDIIPLVKDQLGKFRFVSEDEIDQEVDSTSKVSDEPLRMPRAKLSSFE